MQYPELVTEKVVACVFLHTTFTSPRVRAYANWICLRLQGNIFCFTKINDFWTHKCRRWDIFIFNKKQKGVLLIMIHWLPINIFLLLTGFIVINMDTSKYNKNTGAFLIHPCSPSDIIFIISFIIPCCFVSITNRIDSTRLNQNYS